MDRFSSGLRDIFKKKLNIVNNNLSGAGALKTELPRGASV